MKGAREGLINSNKEKQRVINTSLDLIQNPAYKGFGTKAILPYYDTIQKILVADPSQGSGLTLSEVVEIDLTSLNLLQ